MGLRFRKSIKILPGVKINVNKNSSSVTFGTKGAHYTINSKGTRTTTVGLPGTGLAYTTSSTKKKHNTKGINSQIERAEKEILDSPKGPRWYNKTGWIVFFLIIFFPIGLFLMWKYSNWKRPSKIGITLFFLVLLLISPRHEPVTTTNTNATEISETQPSQLALIESTEINLDTSEVATELSTDIEYHRNEEINSIIQVFNESFSPQISQDEVGRNYSYQTFINTNGINVRIASSNSGLFVDLTLEDANTDKLYSYYCAFTKCLAPEIKDEELADYFEQLQTGNYKNYNYLEYNGLQSTYHAKKLNNGLFSYILKTNKIK